MDHFRGGKHLANKAGEKLGSIVFGVTTAQSLILLGKLPLKMLGHGWAVTVICGKGSATHDPWNGSIPIVEIPMVREISPASDLLALVRWIAVLRRLRPSIVSVGTPKAALLGIIAAKLLSVGHRVYLLRGLRLETTGGMKRILLTLTEVFTSACANQVIAVSKSLGDLYAKLRLAPEHKITLIGMGSSHGVDTTRFSPASTEKRSQLFEEIGLAKGVPVLGFVGRFSRDKGAATLLETAQQLRAKGISTQFLMVGPVEDSYETKTALEMENPNTIWLGPVKDPSLYYSVMDLLLLPTAREGFPNVVLEAGASGIPVVTTDATGAVDSVIDRDTGLISSRKDSSFASHVVTLVEDRELRGKLGSAARTWVSSHYDENLVEQSYELFYANLLRASSQ